MSTRERPYYAVASAEFSGPERRRQMIAAAAYQRAQRRGFEPGHELEDWLAAEAEIDAAQCISSPQ